MVICSLFTKVYAIVYIVPFVDMFLNIDHQYNNYYIVVSHINQRTSFYLDRPFVAMHLRILGAQTVTVLSAF